MRKGILKEALVPQSLSFSQGHAEGAGLQAGLRGDRANQEQRPTRE